MECTQCAMDLAENANFCSRCGQPTEVVDAAVGEASEEKTRPGRRESPEHAEDLALALALREATLAGGLSGKVHTSPFPALPDSPAAQGLPSGKLSGQAIHALLAQANLHRLRRQWDAAIDCCVAVLRALPANQNAHVLLGDIYRDQRRWDDAIQWYGMAVDLRPNPTDQAKLDQVVQERERASRLDALRIRRGYGNSAASPLDVGTDLNTGTANLMGVSPRRWLRGITVTSLAFVCLMLCCLIWASWHRTGTAVAKNNSRPPFSNGGFNLPPHRLDKTPPAHQVAQAAANGRPLLVGGGGMAPDRSTRSTTTLPATPSAVTLPSDVVGAARSLPGTTPTLNLPPAPVQNVRPLDTMPVPAVPSGAVAASSQPTNRLTDGLQHARTENDGGVGATVLLTGAPSLVLEGSARSQDIMIRNVYRAARTAFANNNLLTRVKIMIQTQTASAGQAVMLEAEVDRATAMSANPDKDDAASLQQHLVSFRYVGNSAEPMPTPTTPNSGPPPQ